MPDRPPVSREEHARIERFIAAFNTLDNWLQSQPDAPPTFRSSVDWWARRHPYWHDAESLRLFTSLRNFLVHETVRPFDYPCVPSESAVLEIEAIRDRLLHPASIGQQFGREVVILHPNDTLETALNTMRKRDIARFPIFDGNRFEGVLSERDIARFLSSVVARDEQFTPQTPIHQVLPRQSKRQTFRFATPETSVAQAAFWFGENTFLEAILIAPRIGDRPTGIVTRGDVAGWRE
ncbi:CBS domain-containing protein [bacterium]|nr:MAG: CBS domain-containing protein [bacterium]